MTSPIGQFVDTTLGRTSTNPFITKIMDRPPASTDGINNAYMVGQRWVNTADNNAEYFLLNFLSSNGTVLANWVLLGTVSANTETLTGNSGSAVVADTNQNINVVGDGTTGLLFAGASHTLTGSLNAIPNSALAHSSMSFVAGTGITISSSPVSLGGTTTISANAGTVTETLTGNSGGAVGPAAGNINVVGDGSTISIIGNPGTNTLTASFIGSPSLASVVIQTIISTGTYTPTTGMKYCVIEAIGGGGGGGAAYTTTGSAKCAAGGGGGGGYSRGVYSAATIGVSQAITIGAAGTAGSSAGKNNGGNGGTTIVGALLSVTGGNGGAFSSSDVGEYGMGGTGGVGSSGSFNTVGTPGYAGNISGTFGSSGNGGSSFFGGGANGVFSDAGTNFNGINGLSYGGGGSGGATFSSVTSASGGTGFKGVVIITEYVG